MKPAENNLIEPDLTFINRLIGLTGNDFKKCMQCATCSVACNLAPDNQPFPRKEILWAAWGLKNRLVASHDIWLCHQCGDCNTLCPRGVRPGDVLGAVRACAVDEYAAAGPIGQLFNDPRKILFLFLFPAVLFIVVGMITGLLDFTPDSSAVVHSHFFSHWLVEIIFIPLSLGAAAVFARGLRNFLADVHANALQTGKTTIRNINAGKFLLAFIGVLPDILLHRNFFKCTRNKSRATSHLMVFFGFIALAVVAGLFGAALHLLNAPGPYSQLNPIKWAANLAGIALVAGSSLMIKERLAQDDQASSWGDWYLLGSVFSLGVTGLLVEVTRLAGAASASYWLYFFHLILAFNLIASLPFTKLAHLLYRLAAIVYDRYIERNYGPP